MEASSDLGVSNWQTFIDVLMPIPESAISSGALLVVTLAIEEMIVTPFPIGSRPTLRVYV